MSDVDLTQLRVPFAAEHTGKLPRVTCKDCRDSSSKCCSKHAKSKCGECDNWITSAHMHLDYVGHGAVTHRLLEVDPTWTWEPVAWDDNGLPRMERTNKGDPISLWIRLTVGGVTRLGVGSCEPGKFDAEKILIGDALRNAAMRFGVALDLWIKGHAEDDERAERTQGPNRSANTGPPPVDLEQCAVEAGWTSREAQTEAWERLRADTQAIVDDTERETVITWIKDQGVTLGTFTSAVADQWSAALALAAAKDPF